MNIQIATPYGEIGLTSLTFAEREGDYDRAYVGGKLRIESRDYSVGVVLVRLQGERLWSVLQYSDDSPAPVPWNLEIHPWEDEDREKALFEITAEHDTRMYQHHLIRMAFKGVCVGLRSVLTIPNWQAWVDANEEARKYADSSMYRSRHLYGAGKA
jgi:hypothetical protein